MIPNSDVVIFHRFTHVLTFIVYALFLGVLITMETAMCLIEANQPVYPLETVKVMRDQRAMLIQTSVSLITNPPI